MSVLKFMTVVHCRVYRGNYYMNSRTLSLMFNECSQVHVVYILVYWHTCMRVHQLHNNYWWCTCKYASLLYIHIWHV